MNILQAAILGIVEGGTEFLPVSSTFHLVWTATFLGLPQTPFQKLFEVAIQAGAILAVVASFAKTATNNPKLIAKVGLAFLPTAIIGLLLYPVVKNIFLENILLQLVMFIGVGILFILFERFWKGSYTRSIASITYTEAFIVGVAQALSVIPGTSRAGVVMLTLMILSFSRKDAAAFSFLLAVPTILAASLLDLLKSQEAISSLNEKTMLLVGSIVACASAFVVVKWMLKYLEHHTISVFGWYRVIVGILLLTLFYSL